MEKARQGTQPCLELNSVVVVNVTKLLEHLQSLLVLWQQLQAGIAELMLQLVHLACGQVNGRQFKASRDWTSLLLQLHLLVHAAVQPHEVRVMSASKRPAAKAIRLR